MTKLTNLCDADAAPGPDADAAPDARPDAGPDARPDAGPDAHVAHLILQFILGHVF